MKWVTGKKKRKEKHKTFVAIPHTPEPIPILNTQQEEQINALSSGMIMEPVKKGMHLLVFLFLPKKTPTPSHQMIFPLPLYVSPVACQWMPIFFTTIRSFFLMDNVGCQLIAYYEFELSSGKGSLMNCYVELASTFCQHTYINPISRSPKNKWWRECYDI